MIRVIRAKKNKRSPINIKWSNNVGIVSILLIIRHLQWSGLKKKEGILTKTDIWTIVLCLNLSITLTLVTYDKVIFPRSDPLSRSEALDSRTKNKFGRSGKEFVSSILISFSLAGVKLTLLAAFKRLFCAYPLVGWLVGWSAVWLAMHLLFERYFDVILNCNNNYKEVLSLV